MAVQEREGGLAEPPGLGETDSGWSEVGLEGWQAEGVVMPPPLFAQEVISQFSPLASFAVLYPALCHLFTHVSPQSH